MPVAHAFLLLALKVALTLHHISVLFFLNFPDGADIVSFRLDGFVFHAFANDKLVGVKEAGEDSDNKQEGHKCFHGCNIAQFWVCSNDKNAKFVTKISA